MPTDPVVTIPLQVPTSTVKSAAALQIALNAVPYVIEYVIPSHPQPEQREWVMLAASTNVALIPSPGANIRTALTMISVFLTASASVNCPVRIGFAVTALPAETPLTAGVAQIVVNHELTPGGGVVIGNGASVFCLSSPTTVLRVTNGVPTGGKLVILASYFQPQIS
jgi:hypothetical protein